MTTQDPKNEGKLNRFWQFMKKIIIWSAFLFVLHKAISYSGWDTWSKFEESTNKFDSVLLTKMQKLSPLSLLYDLRSDRDISIIDTAAKNAVDRYNSEKMKMLFQHQQGEMQEERYYRPEYHKVTIWEKIKDWGRGFWYNDNNTANWFGRIILFISLLLAIPLTRNAEQNRKSTPWASNLYPVNIIVALLYLTLFFLLSYLFMKLILLIAGSLVALFSTLVAMGGIIGYIAEELKFEMMVHFKKKIGP
jgi:hypothetical protein